jgi:hypothetical protein
MLREELDIILVFIEQATLTDNEYDFVVSKNPQNTQERYQALYTVLENRSGVGDATQRLTGYFIAKGYTQIADGVEKNEFNNVSLGVALRL